MAEENEAQIAEKAPSATYTADSFQLDGIDKAAVAKYTERAGDMKHVQAEIREMEIEEPGIIATLFPKEVNGKAVDPAIQMKAKRLEASQAIEAFVTNPAVGAWKISNIFSMPLESFGGLKASLIGPPINWNPVYQPIYPMVLMRATTKEYKSLTEGSDSLEFENPVNVGLAVTHNPGGNPEVVNVVGNRTKIYPIWIRTPYYTVDIMEWAVRLIKTVFIKQRQFRQELDKAIDDLLITVFDAAVPDSSTVYDPVQTSVLHPTHIVTDSSGTLTFANFKKAARYLIHTDSTGTEHNAAPGVAMVDPLSIFALEDEGTDEWTEQTVEWFNNNDFGIDYTRSNVVPRISPKGYVLARNPRATSTKNVRVFAEKEFVGYYVPVSFNGKRTWVRTAPMAGQDPAYGQLKNTNMPPGFQFQIGAWECFAITIPGYLHIAKVAQT